MSRTNWFDQGGNAYAEFRPHYPPALAQWLAQQAPAHQLALDVGCGSGQLTRLLAPHFDAVIGVDPSASQLDAAATLANVRYLCAPAEKLPPGVRDADLITVAQAAHWLDLPAFYVEARRVARPGAVLALITYGTMEFEPALNPRFQHFYTAEVGAYWPPQRRLVDSGYRTLDFPFDEFAMPSMAIEAQWNLPQFLGYVSTWSAVRRLREAGQIPVLQGFARDITALWGAPEQKHLMRWPLGGRIGRME